MVVAMATFTIFTACTESGCTDTDAINYSADATKDDGSCQFVGSVVFWYNEATSSALQNDGATLLNFNLDGEIIGTLGTTYYWNASPDCDQSGAISYIKNLGEEKIRSFSYSIKDQANVEYWSGTIELEANTCIAFQLTQ